MKGWERRKGEEAEERGGAFDLPIYRQDDFKIMSLHLASWCNLFSAK